MHLFFTDFNSDFMCVWIDQILSLKKDDVLILRNSKIQMLKSRMHLRIDAWGILEQCDPNQYDEPIKMDNNVSAIEWELVAPE